MPCGSRPFGGLVEHEDVGLPQQCAGELESLAHAHREAADLPGSGIRQADELEAFVDTAERDARHRGDQPSGDCEPFAPGGSPTPRARRRPASSGWADGDSRCPSMSTEPEVGRHQAEQHPQRGGLAGPVRTEEPGDPSGQRVEIEVVDCEDVTRRSASSTPEPRLSACPGRPPSSVVVSVRAMRASRRPYPRLPRAAVTPSCRPTRLVDTIGAAPLAMATERDAHVVPIPRCAPRPAMAGVAPPNVPTPWRVRSAPTPTGTDRSPGSSATGGAWDRPHSFMLASRSRRRLRSVGHSFRRGRLCLTRAGDVGAAHGTEKTSSRTTPEHVCVHSLLQGDGPMTTDTLGSRA